MKTSDRPVEVEILPSEDEIRREAMARLLEQLAWLMDRAIPIPGTKIRVGLDALLGLLPVGGDLFTGLIQSGLVLTVVKDYRVPKPVAARMAANVLIDIAVGSIPFLGDLFDVGFKANTRNIKLLDEVRQHQQRGSRSPRLPRCFTWSASGAGSCSALGLVFAGPVALAAWVWKSIIPLTRPLRGCP